MEKKIEYKVLHSLHRPFQKPLWVMKWICEYIYKPQLKTKSINSAVLYYNFYFYFIQKLKQEYEKSELVLSKLEGIPPQTTINSICLFFNDKSSLEKNDTLKHILNTKRTKGIETQIYSTYKAVSYYLNLAIDKFKLVDEKFNLTEQALRFNFKKSKPFLISEQERMIYFDRILFCDIHFFIPLCLLTKIAQKEKMLLWELAFDFSKRYYPVPKFNYTTPSLKNYVEVRTYWIAVLEILDSNLNIKKKYISYIKSNTLYNDIYSDMEREISDYTKEINELRLYNNNKIKFISLYKECLELKSLKSEYINLYDIKDGLKMSYDRFEGFISKFYEEERSKMSIFFINTVSSIDQRKRFFIRSTPVLKIKIIKK